MKRVAISIVALMMLTLFTDSADAQWARRYYRRYYRPVLVAPQPMMRVHRRPTVVYQPTTVVYSRRRPILGGYSVRTRPGFQRTVVW
jgi:hypothetical protein